jgi:hypothetical protein
MILGEWPGKALRKVHKALWHVGLANHVQKCWRKAMRLRYGKGKGEMPYVPPEREERKYWKPPKMEEPPVAPERIRGLIKDLEARRG